MYIEYLTKTAAGVRTFTDIANIPTGKKKEKKKSYDSLSGGDSPTGGSIWSGAKGLGGSLINAVTQGKLGNANAPDAIVAFGALAAAGLITSHVYKKLKASLSGQQQQQQQQQRLLPAYA